MKFLLIFAVVLIFFYCYGSKKKQDTKQDRKKLDPEYVESELSFNDIVAYFKTKSLKKDIDTPFMAKINDPKISKIFDIKVPNGYDAILLGTYKDQKDQYENIKLIFAKSLDQKIKDALGADSMVVLS